MLASEHTFTYLLSVFPASTLHIFIYIPCLFLYSNLNCREIKVGFLYSEVIGQMHLSVFILYPQTLHIV